MAGKGRPGPAPKSPAPVVAKVGPGRPTLYTPKILGAVTKLALLGCTNVEIAKSLGIAIATFEGWMSSIPEFSGAIKKGREDADAAVSQSLFQRATGYSQIETHVAVISGEVVKTKVKKNYPPSEIAQFFWLKNRQKDKWKPDSQLSPLGAAPEDLAAALRALADKLPV